jgi:zeaxanthin glucosyltransferase
MSAARERVFPNWQRGSRVPDWRKSPSSRPFFDYPRERLPENFHYTGPWHAFASGDQLEFPLEKLDGRPLIYASMGTLQNRQQAIFQAIATACAGLDAQLVLSLGGHDQRLELKLPDAAIVVPFAPQLELLKRAALTITHAGLNTALESLAQGVPMVAIPITNDQSGVASRLEWLGVAKVVPPGRLSAHRLRASVRAVLSEGHYRARAQQWKAEIGNIEASASLPTLWNVPSSQGSRCDAKAVAIHRFRR